MTTTEDEVVWECDYCNEFFPSESQAVDHEKTCAVRTGSAWADIDEEGDDENANMS